MKLAVLGAGRMGRAIAYDFCIQNDVEQVTPMERDTKILKDGVHKEFDLYCVVQVGLCLP